MTAFGDLSFAAIHDLGPLGPDEGKPVHYYWSIAWSAPLLLPWAAILSLLLLARNRTRGALPAFLWLVAVVALVVLANMATVEFADEMGPLLDCIAILGAALATVWLLSGGAPATHAGRVLGRTLLGFGFLTILGAVSFSGLDPGNAVVCGIITGLFGGFLLVMMVLALLCCRRRVTTARLLRFAFLIIVGIPTALAVTVSFLGAIFDSLTSSRPDVVGAFSEFFLPGIAIGLGIGLGTFFFVAPLLWMATRGHFRARWAADFAWTAPRVVPAVVPLAVAPETPPVASREESLK